MDSILMGEKRVCIECKIPVEQKNVIKHKDHDEIVLKCGHKVTRFRKHIVENIPVSESLMAHIIRFDSDEDMDRAFYELIHNSPTGFTGVTEKEISITAEQEELLKRKNIGYKLIS